MKQAPRNKAAILGTAVGAVIFGSSILLSCQPGALPCDDDEWEALCNSGGSGGGNTGGSGGSGGSPAGGGGGSSTAGMGGSGGGGGSSGGTVGPNTAVPNCDEYGTVGEMDGFFEKRCGVNVACHENAIPWTDLSQENLWEKLMDKTPATACKSDKLIDSASWDKSVLYLKTAAEPPKCSDGTTMAGIDIMPPPLAKQTIPEDQKQDPLSAAEKTCLENYLKVVTGQN